MVSTREPPTHDLDMKIFKLTFNVLTYERAQLWSQFQLWFWTQHSTLNVNLVFQSIRICTSIYIMESLYEMIYIWVLIGQSPIKA